jgi:putative transposase
MARLPRLVVPDPRNTKSIESDPIDSLIHDPIDSKSIESDPIDCVRAGMVAHPSDYPWSSYHYNALGQPDDLITPYVEYLQLGNTAEARQAAYRDLFEQAIPDGSVEAIRTATNKAWVLGDDRFKQRIQQQVARRVGPNARGGDRKSAKYKINRV